jgi:hypothetical protein
VGTPQANTHRPSFLAIARSCHHCRSAAQLAPEDSYHAFFELISSLQGMWLKLLTSLQRVMSLLHRVVVGSVADDVTADRSAAQLAVSAMNTSLLTEEWRFVPYRLLWVLPWSASNVPVSLRPKLIVEAAQHCQ